MNRSPHDRARKLDRSTSAVLNCNHYENSRIHPSSQSTARARFPGRKRNPGAPGAGEPRHRGQSQAGIPEEKPDGRRTSARARRRHIYRRVGGDLPLLRGSASGTQPDGQGREGKGGYRDVEPEDGVRGTADDGRLVPQHQRVFQRPDSAGAGVRRDLQERGGEAAGMAGWRAGQSQVYRGRSVFDRRYYRDGRDRFWAYHRDQDSGEPEEPRALARGGVSAAQREVLVHLRMALVAVTSRGWPPPIFGHFTTMQERGRFF